jgi:predicted nucleic acid-binding protein
VVLVDTTVWIDYLRGTRSPHAAWLDRELSVRRIGLTDVILCEVLQGISTEATARKVERELRKFQIFDSGGIDVAVAAARNYRLLRSRGHTVRRTVDCLIATFCLRGSHELLHIDRDFDPFEAVLGLRVIHP